MARPTPLITLQGQPGWFDLADAKLWLDEALPSGTTLYQTKRGCWVVGNKSDQGGVDYTEIDRTAAARLFIQRGVEPPSDLAHLIAADNIDRPWLDPEAQKWTSGYKENLCRTSRGDWILEKLDEHDQRMKQRGIDIFSDFLWFDHYGFAIPEELERAVNESESNSRPSTHAQRHSGTNACVPMGASNDRDEAAVTDATLNQSIHTLPLSSEKPGDDVTRSLRDGPENRQCHPPSTAVMRAYRSYSRAKEASPDLNTDEQVYKHIKDYGCEEYKGDLPSFETWVRYVRTARKHFGEQKNHPRAGREGGRSITRYGQTG